MTVSCPSRILRLLIALSALLLYGTGARWLVHREGAAHRDSLREVAEPDRPAVVETAPPPRSPACRDEPDGSKAKAIAEAAVSAHVRAAEPPRPPASPIPAPPARETAKALPVPAPSEAAAPVLDPIWRDPEVTKVWDVEHLTIDDEKRLGDALNRLIVTLNVPSDGASAGRVFEAAQPLLAKVTRKGISYRFVVLDSLERNAFSIPGGYVYVTEGLLLSIGKDEEYVLQFVLAHEIAHVDQGHALECLRIPELRSARTVGTAELLYRYVIPNAYFDAHDFAADRFALKCLGELRHGRYESLAFLRKFERYARDHHFVDGRKPPKPDEDRSLLDNHYRAHVSISLRKARAEAILSGAPPDRGR